MGFPSRTLIAGSTEGALGARSRDEETLSAQVSWHDNFRRANPWKLVRRARPQQSGFLFLFRASGWSVKGVLGGAEILPTSSKKKMTFFFFSSSFPITLLLWLLFVAPLSLKNKKKEESGVTLPCSWLGRTPSWKVWGPGVWIRTCLLGC